MMFPKTPRVLDEPYRRLVATLPCVRCEVEGWSQAAHPHILGGGMKADDGLCVPLCICRYGIVGCHFMADQYQLGTAEETNELFVKWDIETKQNLKGGANDE